MLPYRFPDILFVSDKVTPRLPVKADEAFFGNELNDLNELTN